jgi:hypothetical protein
MKQKYFNPKDLSFLALENIVDFWEGDSLIYVTNSFDDYPGYQGGIAMRSDKKSKRIGVAVFESQENAIENMDIRVNTVSWVISPGVPDDVLQGKWWYSEGSIVFDNQYNTIIEVTCIPCAYEEVKTLLTETAAVIANRIDSLSQ